MSKYKVKIGKNGVSKIIKDDVPQKFYDKLKVYEGKGYLLWLFNREYKRYMRLVDFEKFLMYIGASLQGEIR